VKLLLDRVLRFAVANLERLEVNARYWPVDANPDSFVRLIDKVLIESAVLALLATRVEGLSVSCRDSLQILVQLLGKMARGERCRVMLMRFPHPAAALAIPHFVLERLGSHDQGFGHLARRAIKSQHLVATERLPFRAMDLLWSCNLPQDSSETPDFTTLLPQSILARRPHPIYMTRADVYALTHGLMYTTDFGARDLPPSLESRTLAAILDAGIAWHIASEDLDLLGELLLCLPLVGERWSPYAAFGWHLLSTTWAELGFAPSPTFEASEYAALRGDEATAYAFRNIYHTNYVSGMLAAVLLNPRHSEGSSTADWSVRPAVDATAIEDCARAARRGLKFSAARLQPGYSRTSGEVGGASNNAVTSTSASADRHLDLVVAAMGRCDYMAGKSNPRQWHRLLPSLHLEPTAKALVLSDALLIQAARHYELFQLADALGAFAAMRVPPSITFVAAAHFLAAQQLSSGAIGAQLVNPANHETAQARESTRYLSACLSQVAEYLSVCLQSFPHTPAGA
jgi:hypothetical protein